MLDNLGLSQVGLNLDARTGIHTALDRRFEYGAQIGLPNDSDGDSLSLLYLWVALSSASILGFVTVLDKRLASYNMPSLAPFTPAYPSRCWRTALSPSP